MPSCQARSMRRCRVRARSSRHCWYSGQSASRHRVARHFCKPSLPTPQARLQIVMQDLDYVDLRRLGPRQSRATRRARRELGPRPVGEHAQGAQRVLQRPVRHAQDADRRNRLDQDMPEQRAALRVERDRSIGGSEAQRSPAQARPGDDRGDAASQRAHPRCDGAGCERHRTAPRCGFAHRLDRIGHRPRFVTRTGRPPG